MRLELAADYLVMAAWLAYLKSRLLLPEPPKGEEPSAADLATALAERLRRLEAIRRAADALKERARLGRDVFLRGSGESIETTASTKFRASLFDLLSAYARRRQRGVVSKVTLRQRSVWSLAEARVALERLAGAALEWTVLDDFLIQFCVDPTTARTVRASGFLGVVGNGSGGALSNPSGSAFSPIWVGASKANLAVDAAGQ